MRSGSACRDQTSSGSWPTNTFGELFDLQNDPQEYENLWDDPDHRGLRGDLLLQLLEILCQTEDPLPVYRKSAVP